MPEQAMNAVNELRANADAAAAKWNEKANREVRSSEIGYAEEHPELVGAYMMTAAKDFETAITVQRLQGIAGIINRIADAMVGRMRQMEMRHEDQTEWWP
jgi:hypothetical protein